MATEIVKIIRRSNPQKPPRVYIAGPMRGIEKFNYPLFDRTAEMLRSLGLFVVNPTEVSALMGTPDEIDRDPKFLARLFEADFALLKTCDAIAMLPGWERSAGARRELAAAIEAGLDVVRL